MNDKELTYEEALEGLEDIALYRKGGLSIFEKIFFKKIKEAIEKAKKYDLLAKEKE